MTPQRNIDGAGGAPPQTGGAPLPLIGAHIGTAGGLAHVPERALAIGAEVVQIFNTNARMWRTQMRTPAEVTTLTKGLKRHQLPLFFHSIYLINLAATDVALRERSISALCDALVLGAVTGAAGVVTHVGARHQQSFQEAARCVSSAVDEVISQATDRLRRRDLPVAQSDDARLPERLLADATLPHLLLETSAGSGSSVGARLEELAEIVSRVEGPCGICLDTAHMFAAGYPVHTDQGLGRVVEELTLSGLLPLVGLIHLNDSKTDLGSLSDRHENLGDGRLGTTGLGHVVRHPAFRQVPFVLEVPGMEKTGPDLINVQRAKSMRREPEAPPAPPAPPA